MNKLRQSLAVLVLGCVVLSGCGDGTPRKLTVGTVDVMRVMEERPETRAIRLEWSSQAGDTYMRLSDVQDSAEAMALQKEIEERSAEWQKRVDAFMEESIQLVEASAAEIAKERGIDLVVVDNPLTQTVKYREGEDITTDISLLLQKRNS